MKTQIRFFVVFIFFFLVLLVSVGLTQAQGNQDYYPPHQITSHANLPWSSQYVQRELNPPRDVADTFQLRYHPLMIFWS
jgi:hypothetical protein